MTRWIRTLGALSRSLLEMHGHLPAPRRTRVDTAPGPQRSSAPPRSTMARLRARARAARRRRAHTERHYVSGTR